MRLAPLKLLHYVLFKRGMLASGGGEGFAFTQVRPGPVAAPDLEILFMPFERRKEFLEPPREHAFTIAFAAMAPRSPRLRKYGHADRLPSDEYEQNGI